MNDWAEIAEEFGLRQEEAWLKKKEKVHWKSWSGAVYLYEDDRFFETIQSLKSYLEDCESLPDYVYATTEHTASLNAEEILCSAEESFEIEEYDWKDKEELVNFIEEWSGKQTSIFWSVDHTKIVLLDGLMDE